MFHRAVWDEGGRSKVLTHIHQALWLQVEQSLETWSEPTLELAADPGEDGAVIDYQAVPKAQEFKRQTALAAAGWAADEQALAMDAHQGGVDLGIGEEAVQACWLCRSWWMSAESLRLRNCSRRLAWRKRAARLARSWRCSLVACSGTRSPNTRSTGSSSMAL